MSMYSEQGVGGSSVIRIILRFLGLGQVIGNRVCCYTKHMSMLPIDLKMPSASGSLGRSVWECMLTAET